jgi:aspartate aminotransferase-like enzyme
MSDISHTLFTPGPTKVPDVVLQAIARPPLHHRSDEFRELITRVSGHLQYLFQTTGPVLVLTCSGTGAMEATFVNLFSSGERVLVISNGKFSDRWVQMPGIFGLDVVEIKLDWGKSPTSSLMRNVLLAHSDVSAVYLTHCETSTGATTDIKTLSRIVHDNSDALVCVDGVSSVGALEFRFDAWGIDVAVTASQKALMCPPGLACVALSDRALRKIKSSDLPKYYLNLSEALSAHDHGSTPWTPAVSLVAGLDAALAMIRNEEITNVWNRHRTIGTLTRQGIVQAGFKIFPECPSDSVTVASVPSSVLTNNFLNKLKTEKGMILGRGQGKFKDKLIRVGHMGYYFREDINALLNAITAVLLE